MFVFREEYYLQRKEPREGTPEHLTWQAEMEQLLGLAEVIIGKQRHGPTGTVSLQFQADVTRFSDHAQQDHFPEARKRDVTGKSGAVRVNLGGRRDTKKK